MKLFVFAVRDVKAEHFGKPIFQVSAGEALRSFQMECQNPESMFNRFPDDYYLFRLGQFDQVTGELDPETPVQISWAREFVKEVVDG